jgi:hypothetical protein
VTKKSSKSLAEIAVEALAKSKVTLKPALAKSKKAVSEGKSVPVTEKKVVKKSTGKATTAKAGKKTTVRKRTK